MCRRCLPAQQRRLNWNRELKGLQTWLLPCPPQVYQQAHQRFRWLGSCSAVTSWTPLSPATKLWYQHMHMLEGSNSHEPHEVNCQAPRTGPAIALCTNSSISARGALKSGLCCKLHCGWAVNCQHKQDGLMLVTTGRQGLKSRTLEHGLGSTLAFYQSWEGSSSLPRLASCCTNCPRASTSHSARANTVIRI